MSAGPIISRRAGLRAAGLLAGSALLPAARAQTAQSALRQPVVTAVAVPCAERSDDLTGLVLEGTGRAIGGIVVFGLPFRPGDLPRGVGIAARRVDGRPVRAQLDVSVRHPDGSARHGLVSLEAPGLGDGGRLGIILSRTTAAASEPALSFAAATAGREAIVELSAVGTDTPWRADLLALLRSVTADRPWQAGPLAHQRRVSVMVPPAAVGGIGSMRLVADVSVRADGTLWVDAWFRNDIAMQPNGGTATYLARVLLDGREMLRADMPAHHQYRGWGRLLGSDKDKATPPQLLVRHDAGYLAETGAVARYDQTIGVAESLLVQVARRMAEPDWQAPFGTRGLAPYMPTSGGRLDIGPTTGWQAAWLISGDRRAAAWSIGQAEAAATIPWHFWDISGGADGRGGWLDAKRWPRFWTDRRGGEPPRGLRQQVSGETGWVIDPTHQPGLAFVPYLLTGRRAFADELMAQGAWNVIGIWPAVRNPPGLPNSQEGMIVVQNRQVRGAAWSLRQVDEAAWAAPDGDANQLYLREVATRNWAWLRAQIPAWTRFQGEPHGWLVPESFGGGGIDLAPWQQDYVASVVAAAARRGNDDARVFLAWMSNFLVGRFEATDRGFARNDGAAYQMAMGQGGTELLPLRSWASLGEAMRARGFSNGDGWAKSQGEYARLALQSLAQISDVLNDERAARAYAWLAAARPPFTDADSRSRNPTLNIVPRAVSAASCLSGRRG